MALIATVLLPSCVSDEPSSADTEILSPAVRVTANLSRSTHTRAYQDSGRVENGIYYLTYPVNGNQYALATADFDLEAAVTPGLGIVRTASGNELKWTEVNGSPATFCLDNVKPDLALPGTSDTPVVTLNPATNPYVAGKFDAQEGTNDLLWGDKSVGRDTRSIAFDLHHNMSRVRVQAQIAHVSDAEEEITLDGAKVEITGLYPRTVSFNRIDGTLELDTEEGVENITIVDSSDSDMTWLSVTPDTENKTTTYVSQDIVLPPQALQEDETRSQLVITLENGDVYSGILPYVMLVANGESDELAYPITLSFLKEHILTIRTVITEQPPELAFMPVWVVDWVDKGDFTLEAHQSGIYKASEFYRLIEYYNANNKYQLVRYGYLYTPQGSNKEEWNFDFWSGVVLDYGQIANTMKPGTPVDGKGETDGFSFNYNNYSVFVQNGEDGPIKQVNPAQLYGIVTGSLTWAQL